jgi:sugar phosphate isomerase/epimerase
MIAAGLCSVTFRARPVEEVAAIGASCGLGAIEWAGDAHCRPGDIAAARRAAAAAAGHGIASASYGSYVQAGAAGAEFAPALETALALGAQTIRVWAGARGVASAQADAAARAAAAAFLHAAAEQAAPHGVAVALEYHALTLTDTIASCRALLHQADHPNLFSYWQPAYGLTDAGVARAELAALGARLRHMHVFAWTVTKQRLPLADHAHMWRAALAAAAPGPRLALLEFVADDDPAALARDAATLRGWLADQAGGGVSQAAGA